MDSSSDGVRLDYTDGRCSLTIDRVRVEHEAEYVCTATNQHGSASTWAELLVESSYAIIIYSFIMAALCNKGAIIFLPCNFFPSSFFFYLFFLSSPNLSGRRLDVCHTSTHGVALVRI